MIVFDGYAAAAEREKIIKQKVVGAVAAQFQPRIGAILFAEDAGSQLYTRLKKEAAERVGIGYEVATFSALDPVQTIIDHVQAWNSDPTITGIIIQKPWRSKWVEVTGQEPQAFASWWNSLVTALELTKDVDGLHPQTLAAIENDTWSQQGMVLPATCQAVITIMQASPWGTWSATQRAQAKVAIIGKSDLLGRPLYFYLKNQGYAVDLLGKRELAAKQASGANLTEYEVVVSATGQEQLVRGEMVKPGVIVIDVGEPKPDVDFASVSQKATFMTPVPGGVGPMTVVSLLENALIVGRSGK